MNWILQVQVINNYVSDVDFHAGEVLLGVLGRALHEEPQIPNYGNIRTKELEKLPDLIDEIAGVRIGV